MAYIANTAFEARITNNSRDNLSHIAGLYQADGAAADCSAGFLCVRAGRAPAEGFDNPSGTRVYNENTWIMNVAEGPNADAVVYACDTYDNQLVTAANGNSYFIGTATLGLGVPAGRYGNFTRINFDNESVYRFGIGNISGDMEGSETAFAIANGLLSPGSEPTEAGEVYFKILGFGNLIEGTGQSFGYVDVMACKVSVAG